MGKLSKKQKTWLWVGIGSASLVAAYFIFKPKIKAKTDGSKQTIPAGEVTFAELKKILDETVKYSGSQNSVSTEAIAGMEKSFNTLSAKEKEAFLWSSKKLLELLKSISGIQNEDEKMSKLIAGMAEMQKEGESLYGSAMLEKIGQVMTMQNLNNSNSGEITVEEQNQTNSQTAEQTAAPAETIVQNSITTENTTTTAPQSAVEPVAQETTPISSTTVPLEDVFFKNTRWWIDNYTSKWSTDPLKQKDDAIYQLFEEWSNSGFLEGIKYNATQFPTFMAIKEFLISKGLYDKLIDVPVTQEIPVPSTSTPAPAETGDYIIFKVGQRGDVLNPVIDFYVAKTDQYKTLEQLPIKVGQKVKIVTPKYNIVTKIDQVWTSSTAQSFIVQSVLKNHNCTPNGTENDNGALTDNIGYIKTIDQTAQTGDL